MMKHDTIHDTRMKMSDNIFHTLRFYLTNDKKGKGVMGIPPRVQIKDVNSAVRHGWLSERPVGVNSIYQITQIGQKALSEKEKYLNTRMQDPANKNRNFTFDDRPRTMRRNVRM